MLKNRLIGGILLMSCTTIGGGVLALPTSTVLGGFYPTVIVFSLCWFFMLISSLYLLEVSLWFKEKTNLITMAQKTIGLPGMIVAWVSYLLLLTALLSAYLTGSSAWLKQLTYSVLDYNLDINASLWIIILILASTIYMGTRALDNLNKVFSALLFIAFGMLLFYCYEDINASIIYSGEIKTLLPNIPLIITSFGSAIVVPTLVTYLQHDNKKLLTMVIVGSLIPLLMYIIWEWTTLGILSIPGEYGLESLAQNKADSTEVASSLAAVTGNYQVNFLVKLFSVSAILTSVFGVSISLYHFLSDGLKLATKGKSAIILLAITFIPSILILQFFPAGFNQILNIGGIIVSVLLGILPITMAWGGRYVAGVNKVDSYMVPGGKFTMIVGSLFFCLTIIIRLFVQ